MYPLSKNVWFTPLSPRSTDLLPSLTGTLAVLIETLASRLRPEPLAEWIRIDLPDVLAGHVRAWRAAAAVGGSRLGRRDGDSGGGDGYWERVGRQRATDRSDDAEAVTYSEEMGRSTTERGRISTTTTTTPEFEATYARLNPHLALLVPRSTLGGGAGPTTAATRPTSQGESPRPSSSGALVGSLLDDTTTNFDDIKDRRRAEQGAASRPTPSLAEEEEESSRPSPIDPLYLTQLASHLLSLLLPPLSPSSQATPSVPLSASLTPAAPARYPVEPSRSTPASRPAPPPLARPPALPSGPLGVQQQQQPVLGPSAGSGSSSNSGLVVSRLATPLERTIVIELLGRTVLHSVLTRLSRPAEVIRLLLPIVTGAAPPAPEPPLRSAAAAGARKGERANDDDDGERGHQPPPPPTTSRSTDQNVVGGHLTTADNGGSGGGSTSAEGLPPRSTSADRFEVGPNLLALALGSLNALALLLSLALSTANGLWWLWKVWKRAKRDEREARKGRSRKKSNKGADSGSELYGFREEGMAETSGSSRLQTPVDSRGDPDDGDDDEASTLLLTHGDDNDDGDAGAGADFLDPWFDFLRELCSGSPGGTSGAGETSAFAWATLALILRLLNRALLNTYV